MESISAARGTNDHDRHTANVSRSLRELQRAVKEHEETLNRIQETNRSQQPPGADGVEGTIASLKAMTEGYQEAAGSAPFLPFQDSVLPALLAMRKTQEMIVDSRSFLQSRTALVEKGRRRLAAEEANLEDQRALQQSLESRIASLRSDLESRQAMTTRQITQERLDELRLKKRNFDKDTAALLKAFKKFLANQLAPLLAAEELGGPVVGDIMEVDPDGLAAGFNSRGAVKKQKGGSAAVSSDRRQQRIDQIWGSAEDRPGPPRSREEWDETAAAGSEVRELIQELTASLLESGGDSSAAYVSIPRETAAVRFLVRSRVAQFHPRDATRLRLVDFGRELDD